MKTTILRLLFALLLVFMLLTSQSVRPAYAASYVVNSLGDAVVNDSACTLREAILAANNAPANANCGAGSAGNDTITFSVSGTIPLSSNLPDIVSASTAGTLTINGGGNIAISGNNAVRVMVVNSGANLTLQNLTIANGNTSGIGGGISSAGTLNVTNSTFSSNSASFGGGIYNTSTLNMSKSTVSANDAIAAGGGIFNNGTLNVSSSTFSANSASAGHGGGIYNGFMGTLNVSNSTFANNSANSSLGGGGIFNGEATLNVTNSSFSGNSAPFGGGIRNSDGTATLNNTLIANSASGGDCVTSVPLSGANNNNLIEDSTNACGLVNGVNGNIIGSDPNLGALTGSPAYFPLNPGSLAIDAGDNPTCAAAPVNNQSQNGMTRPQDGDDADSTATCDIGSYEASFPKLTATKTNTVGGVITLGNSFTWTVTVANTGAAGATFAAGHTILRDDLPAGATYGAPTVQNLVGVSGSGSITCNITSNVLICYTGGGPVTLGATTGQFDVVFSVTPTAAGALTNPASGGVCRTDPFGAIVESSESNNDCTPNTVTVDGIPDLTAAKSNNAGGAITLGNSFTWTVTVANSGPAAATFASGQTILRDNLPGGPSYGAPTVQNLVNVIGSGSITCHITFSMLTCTASGGSVTLGATTGAFDVVFSVTPTAAGALTNPASGGVCRTDPDNNIIESSEINNDCADTVTVGGVPDLTAAKSNTVGGAITLGNSFTWTVTVANSGPAAATFASGQTILQDNLPGGPTYGAPTVQNIVNVTNSSNISCTIASNVLICYAGGGPVALGATTGAFEVAFSVTPTAAGALTNPASGVCRADPFGAIAESSESNNDCTPNTVTVDGIPDLTAAKSNTVGGAITLGNSFTWTVTVANSGAAGATFAASQTILRDDLPSGPSYGAPTVQDLVNVSGSIGCTIASNVLICYASGGPVTLGATTGAFAVVFSVTPTAAGALTNPASGGVCRADPFGAIAESSESNNDCADTVTVGGVTDLTAAKRNNAGGAITLGNPFTWTVSVTNTGAAGATFAASQTILRDDLPAGPTYGTPTVQNAINVSGSIGCTIASNVLICTASGGSVTLGATTGAFDVAFSVTPTLTGALTNPASGGICRADPFGVIVESSESNNDCADTVTVGGVPDLAATKSNNVGGAITLGNSFTWTVSVTNTGAAGATFTSGQTILQDNLPGGPTYGAPTVQNLVNVSGSGSITCNITFDVLMCYASGGAVTLGAFDVAFSVTPTAAGALTNPASGGICRADPDGAITESSESNNDCADTVTVGGVPDLTAAKRNNAGGVIMLGNSFTWTVTVVNSGTAGATFAAGQTILRNDLPAGATYGAPTVQNLVNVSGSGSIACAISSGTLTCTATGGPVMLGATTGAFDVDFGVTPNAAGALTNPTSGGVCRADPDGAITESSESNNDCADTVTVNLYHVYLPLTIR